MANVELEPRSGGGSIVPWLIGLAVLIVVVGWLLYRNNRLPEGVGAADLAAEAG